jgi:hypothetical protein
VSIERGVIVKTFPATAPASCNAGRPTGHSADAVGLRRETNADADPHSPEKRDQPIAHPLSIVVVPLQFFGEESFLHENPRGEHQDRQERQQRGGVRFQLQRHPDEHSNRAGGDPEDQFER